MVASDDGSCASSKNAVAFFAARAQASDTGQWHMQAAARGPIFDLSGYLEYLSTWSTWSNDIRDPLDVDRVDRSRACW